MNNILLALFSLSFAFVYANENNGKSSMPFFPWLGYRGYAKEKLETETPPPAEYNTEEVYTTTEKLMIEEYTQKPKPIYIPPPLPPPSPPPYRPAKPKKPVKKIAKPIKQAKVKKPVQVEVYIEEQPAKPVKPAKIIKKKPMQCEIQSLF